jgi:hypothetical protein
MGPNTLEEILEFVDIGVSRRDFGYGHAPVLSVKCEPMLSLLAFFDVASDPKRVFDTTLRTPDADPG